MHTLVLSTGSNLGDRMENLQSAMSLIEKSIGPVIRSSSIYESRPWGYRSENLFYNQCHQLETELEPGECMERIRYLERKMGRERNPGEGQNQSTYSDRVIDIDILFYDKLVLELEALTIPHPKMRNRKFVLVPLAEILPDFEHPLFRKTVRELLEACSDPLNPAKVG